MIIKRPETFWCECFSSPCYNHKTICASRGPPPRHGILILARRARRQRPLLSARILRFMALFLPNSALPDTKLVNWRRPAKSDHHFLFRVQCCLSCLLCGHLIWLGGRNKLVLIMQCSLLVRNLVCHSDASPRRYLHCSRSIPLLQSQVPFLLTLSLFIQCQEFEIGQITVQSVRSHSVSRLLE